MLHDDGMMQYVVVIERTEKNYGAYVPDLPGCVAVAETRVSAPHLHCTGSRQGGTGELRPLAGTSAWGQFS